MNINDIDDVFKENIEGNIEEFLLSFPYRVHVTKGKDNKRTSLQIEVEAWAYSCGLEDKAHAKGMLSEYSGRLVNIIPNYGVYKGPAKIARLDNEGIWKEVIERQNKALSLVNE
jgi:hypothetical protein